MKLASHVPPIDIDKSARIKVESYGILTTRVDTQRMDSRDRKKAARSNFAEATVIATSSRGKGWNRIKRKYLETIVRKTNT